MPRNQHGARCSRQNRRGAARTRALAQKPGTDHDFLGKVDLCGPEHLAKKPFPQSTVFSAEQARTCADPSLQTRNLPRTTVLSAKQARTLLRAFGNYKGYNRNIPQLEQQAQHAVSLSCTKLSFIAAVAISKRAIPMSSPSLPAFSCNPYTHTHTITRMCILFPTKKLDFWMRLAFWLLHVS